MKKRKKLQNLQRRSENKFFFPTFKYLYKLAVVHSVPNYKIVTVEWLLLSTMRLVEVQIWSNGYNTIWVNLQVTLLQWILQTIRDPVNWRGFLLLHSKDLNNCKIWLLAVRNCVSTKTESQHLKTFYTYCFTLFRSVNYIMATWGHFQW